MRTVVEAVHELKQIDPANSLTVSGLRRLIKEKKLKIIKIGNRNLVNFDQFLSYLNNPTIEEIFEEGNLENAKQIETNRITQYKKNIGMLK